MVIRLGRAFPASFQYQLSPRHRVPAEHPSPTLQGWASAPPPPERYPDGCPRINMSGVLGSQFVLAVLPKAKGGRRSLVPLSPRKLAVLGSRYSPTRDLPTQDSASSRALDDNKETLSSASIVAPLWALTQTSCRSDCITSSSSCLPARAARLDCPRVLEETVRVHHRQAVSVYDLRT